MQLMTNSTRTAVQTAINEARACAALATPAGVADHIWCQWRSSTQNYLQDAEALLGNDWSTDVAQLRADIAEIVEIVWPTAA